MKKSTGPKTRWETIPMASCEWCEGNGLIKGIFHDIQCDQCLGAGLVDKRTGDALPPVEVIVQLRLRLNEARKELARWRPKNGEDRGYGRRKSGFGLGGRPYHGD